MENPLCLSLWTHEKQFDIKNSKSKKTLISLFVFKIFPTKNTILNGFLCENNLIFILFNLIVESSKDESLRRVRRRNSSSSLKKEPESDEETIYSAQGYSTAAMDNADDDIEASDDSDEDPDRSGNIFLNIFGQSLDNHWTILLAILGQSFG